MFTFESRYYPLETAQWTQDDGRIINHVRRRFAPPAERLPTLATVIISQGVRLDQIAAQAYANPEQYWHIADASEMMNPFEAMTEIGRVLRIPLPQPAGATVPLAPFPTPAAIPGANLGGGGR